MMFTYIELSKFKSFGNIRFDFKETKAKIKKFIAIYGENGSGKSNFVSAVQLLMKSITSLSDNHKLQELKTLLENSKEITLNMDSIDNSIFDLLRYNDLSDDLKKCRMIDSDDISKVTYGFMIDGIEGSYSISFTDEIVEEELYYQAKKQRGVLYKINRENNEINIRFNPVVFSEESYKDSIIDKLNMYWGKHSFLSLLLSEIQDKNYDYIQARLSDNLLAVLENFMNVFMLCKTSKYQHIGIISGSEFDIRNFESIEIPADDIEKKKQIEKIEKIIDDFYTQAYSDIVGVYYDNKLIHKGERTIQKYELYVKKIIAGKIRIIPFKLESAGTQSVLAVLRATIEAINGQTVIYDEIDAGIHDLLMKNILESVQDEISGQLIITTHNTLLLETLNPKCAYVIYTDHEGNKDARCINDYDVRIQKSNNARKLYLNGIFGGVPYVSDIDYSLMHIN